MDAADVRRLQAELGFGQFAKRMASDPELRAAWERLRDEDPSLRSVAQKGGAQPVESQPVGGSPFPDRLWNVSREGRDHPIVAIPVGSRLTLRAVGDLVVVSRHWMDTGPKICFGKHCPHCPSERRRDGYFDAIAVRVLRDQTRELYRCIASITNAAVQALGDGDDGDTPLRGMKIEFFRAKKQSRTLVNVVEATCATSCRRRSTSACR